MDKEFWIKIIKNKSNGQFVASLPKKELPDQFIKDFDKLGKNKIKVKLEGWF